MPRKIIEGSVYPTQSHFSGLREIQHMGSVAEEPYKDKPCPSCGGKLTYGRIPFPGETSESSPFGNWGYTCSSCGKQFSS